MYVNPITLLILEISQKEADECFRLGEKIVTTGEIEWEHPIVREWMDTCAADSSQKLLLVGVVLPQRLLLSYIYYIQRGKK